MHKSMSQISPLEKHLTALLADYTDLASPRATTFDAPPAPLEALRMLHRSHPAIIRGFCPVTAKGKGRDWSAPSTYEEILGEQSITIAITDDGLADSVRVVLDDGSTTFVKPLEEQMSIKAFMDKMRDTDESEVVYLQSQDGNIHRSTPSSSSSITVGVPQLSALQPYIQRDVPWMLDAVGSTAEAVNLWIGSSRSTTSLHHDPYENIYHVLSGSKTFTLVSPIAGLWLDQKFHRPSTLRRTPTTALEPNPDPSPVHPVPWVQSADLPPVTSPLVITIREGETLYLPAGWWHRVEQEEGSEGLAVAVNYWYTSELYAERYAFERFARRIAREAGRDGVIPNLEDLQDEAESGSEGSVDLVGVWDSGDSGDSGEEWDPQDWGR